MQSTTEIWACGKCGEIYRDQPNECFCGSQVEQYTLVRADNGHNKIVVAGADMWVAIHCRLSELRRVAAIVRQGAPESSPQSGRYESGESSAIWGSPGVLETWASERWS